MDSHAGRRLAGQPGRTSSLPPGGAVRIINAARPFNTPEPPSRRGCPPHPARRQPLAAQAYRFDAGRGDCPAFRGSASALPLTSEGGRT